MFDVGRSKSTYTILGRTQPARNTNAASKERDSFGALMGMKLFSLFKHYIGTKDGTCFFLTTGKRRNDGMMTRIQPTGRIRLFHGTDLLCRKSDQFNHKTSIPVFLDQFSFRYF